MLEALVAAHPLRERLWALLVTALYRAIRTDSRVQPGAALDVVGQLVERSLVVVDQPVGSGLGWHALPAARQRPGVRPRAGCGGRRRGCARRCRCGLGAADGRHRRRGGARAGPGRARRPHRRRARDGRRRAGPGTAGRPGRSSAVSPPTSAGRGSCSTTSRAPPGCALPGRRTHPARCRRGRCSWRAGSRRCPATWPRPATRSMPGRRSPATTHSSPPGTPGSCCWRRPTGGTRCQARATTPLAADLLAGLRSEDSATGVHERRSQVP